MKKKTIELNVDFIGGKGSLTKEEEQALSDFFKSQKISNAKKTKTSHRNKVAS